MLIKKPALQGNYFQSSEEGLSSEVGRDLSPFLLLASSFRLRTKVVCGVVCEVGPGTLDTLDFSVGSAAGRIWGARPRVCDTHTMKGCTSLFARRMEWGEGKPN